MRVCAISGNYTTDAQRTPIRKEDGFTQYQVSSQEFAVNWKTESWNDAIWLSDYVKKMAFPDLNLDFFAYLIKGEECPRLNGRYQVLKLEYSSWGLKPGLFKRMKADGVWPNMWLYDYFKEVKKEMKLEPETEKRVRDTFLVLTRVAPNDGFDCMTDELIMRELYPKRIAQFLKDDELQLPLKELRRP
jgi:hypothetical protein